MKNKQFVMFLSILTLLLSFASAIMGYLFMGAANLSFTMRFVCGVVFLVTPTFVVQLLRLVWKKDR